MTDAVSDMLRDRSEPKPKEVELPKVTAIVKYDLYPYYNVIEGELNLDGSVRWGTNGTFRQELVVRVLPVAAFETHNILLEQIKRSYRNQERQLRIDILKQSGVDFVTVP